MNYVFIAVALDNNAVSIADKSKIVEVAAIRTNENGAVKCAFSEQVNDDLPNAIKDMKKAILAANSNDYVVVSHFCELTRGWLNNANDSEEVFPGRAWIDTAQLAWPLQYSGLIKGRRLEDLADYLCIDVTEKAGAESACSLLMQVYNELMKRYRTALIGENTLNGFGGETLQGLRHILQF